MLKDEQVKETQEFITICDNMHMYISCAYNFLYKVFCVRIVEIYSWEIHSGELQVLCLNSLTNLLNVNIQYATPPSEKL